MNLFYPLLLFPFSSLSLILVFLVLALVWWSATFWPSTIQKATFASLWLALTCSLVYLNIFASSRLFLLKLVWSLLQQAVKIWENCHVCTAEWSSKSYLYYSSSDHMQYEILWWPQLSKWRYAPWRLVMKTAWSINSVRSVPMSSINGRPFLLSTASLPKWRLFKIDVTVKLLHTWAGKIDTYAVMSPKSLGRQKILGIFLTEVYQLINSSSE